MTCLCDIVCGHFRIILETDGAAIASRVSRPRTDTTDIVINEQTIMNACKSFACRLWTALLCSNRLYTESDIDTCTCLYLDSNLKEQMVRRIGQL